MKPKLPTLVNVPVYRPEELLSKFFGLRPEPFVRDPFRVQQQRLLVLLRAVQRLRCVQLALQVAKRERSTPPRRPHLLRPRAVNRHSLADGPLDNRDRPARSRLVVRPLAALPRVRTLCPPRLAKLRPRQQCRIIRVRDPVRELDHGSAIRSNGSGGNGEVW